MSNNVNAARDDYEPLYLAGVVLFNAREFFDAHEVLEDLWNECAQPDRRFYQAVLQAAVALYHFGNGNLRGSVKLFKSARAYMDPYPEVHLGLDRLAFWKQMDVCFAPVFAEGVDLTRRDLQPEDVAIVDEIRRMRQKHVGGGTHHR